MGYQGVRQRVGDREFASQGKGATSARMNLQTLFVSPSVSYLGMPTSRGSSEYLLVGFPASTSTTSAGPMGVSSSRPME